MWAVLAGAGHRFLSVWQEDEAGHPLQVRQGCARQWQPQRQRGRGPRRCPLPVWLSAWWVLQRRALLVPLLAQLVEQLQGRAA